MALMTLRQAKSHLKIPIDASDSDADILMKVEQASAILLDYLKVRPIAIETLSAANPSVVTTSVPHSLVTGSTYTIVGTTTTPDANGARVVTVTGPTTFTIPLNITSGQTSAAGTIGTPNWTETTVPLPIQAAALLMLSHLFEHRGEEQSSDLSLWTAIDRLVTRFRDPAYA